MISDSHVKLVLPLLTHIVTYLPLFEDAGDRLKRRGFRIAREKVASLLQSRFRPETGKMPKLDK